MKEWYQLIDILAPHIVKIETQQGSGTGFFCGHNERATLTAIATARHVIEEADKWQQPIRIHNLRAKTTILLDEGDRVILPDSKKDSAIIAIFNPAKVTTLQLPQQPIPFITAGSHLRIGVEVGWLGYPGLAIDTLCFFCGNVSAWDEDASSYFIDGVAINGVSGGPVLHRTLDSVQLIGSITAYMLNRQIGGPGLSIAQDVSHFQDFVTQMKSMDEAARRKKEQEINVSSALVAGTAPSVIKS
jgi:hypothetical protein